MGYYMRYLSTSDKTVTLDAINAALKQVDSTYSITPDPAVPTIGELRQGDYVCGDVEINLPDDEDDDIFAEDIDDLRDLVEDSDQDSEDRVLKTLDDAKMIVAVNAVWQGGDPSVTLDRLEPLWDWLFDNYPGLLQADNEGFYDRSDLIFETNLKI